MKEVHYRIDALAGGHFPGHHRSARGGDGFEFRGHARLVDAPDVRRLDLQASLRDPFGDWRVRTFAQRKAIPVVVVADLSASMACAGRIRKAEVLADLVGSLAWSAWRTGDSFGFIGCDAEVRPEWLTLPTRRRGVGAPLAQALRHWQPQGSSASSAAGLLQAPPLLGRQRALLLLVSDFHFPLPQVAALLQACSAHALLPVVLWDAQEFDLGPRHGLARVRDPESGRERLVWWRPALRARWQQAQQQRRRELQALFAAQGLRPLFIEDAYDADVLTRHFHTSHA